MTVSDRWHKSHPDDGEPRCGEHRGKVAATGHGSGKRWMVRYRDQNDRQRSRSFDKLGDAQAFDTTRQVHLSRDGWFDPDAGKITLRTFAEQRWLPSRVHLRANSAARYEQHLRTRILPVLGDRQIGKLRRSDMQAFVAAMSAELAPVTVSGVFSTLKAVLSAAVDERLIASNPATRVPLPRIERHLVTPLERDQVVLLASKITARYRVAVMLAAMAGLRQGEVLGLRVADIDFLRRRIQVRQQIQLGEVAPLKTKASLRTIAAGDLLLAELTEHMRRYPPGADGLLLTVKRATLSEAWRAAVKAAGLPKGTRFHDLRHFYASVLIDANLNPKVIQARMGHATISETMDTYGHLFPDSDDLGRQAFDDLFGDGDVHGKCTGETGS